MGDKCSKGNHMDQIEELTFKKKHKKTDPAPTIRISTAYTEYVNNPNTLVDSR
jgi:hypothetical protein